MINRDDIEAFADMSTAELINQISVLTGEIEYAKFKFACEIAKNSNKINILFILLFIYFVSISSQS